MTREMYRQLLKQADALLRVDDYDGALHVYREVARAYAAEGFALKAVAVWKQIREIIGRHARAKHALDGEARAALIVEYRRLGLELDALAIETECAVIEADKRTLH